jgi:hypothetical protein
MDQITTYATLQTAVAGTLHRAGDTDITGNAPLWIQMCEADLNDRLLLKDSESDETLTLVADQNYVALPSGFVSPIAFWLIVDSERLILPHVLPEQLRYFSESGQPRFWAIDAANIRFDCPSDSAYSARLRCVKKSNLSITNTTNYLLLRRPDIYLYGTLVQACLFANDDEGAKKWMTFYEGAIQSLRNAETRSRSVSLRTELPGPHHSSILRGE